MSYMALFAILLLILAWFLLWRAAWAKVEPWFEDHLRRKHRIGG